MRARLERLEKKLGTKPPTKKTANASRSLWSKGPRMTAEPAPARWQASFFTLWGSQALSLFGSSLVHFALIWWLTSTTKSATVLALASLVGLLPNVILALSVTYWPWFARVVYAETRALQKEAFVESTAALGASPCRLTVLHVLPNIASPIIVRSSIGMGFTILTAAALGFLGLGPPPPTPEWGRTIAESREFLPDAWWYATAPGLAIFLTVMGFNLLGDGLRDVLDPRLRRGRIARGD